jgi:hypothetical protein
VASFERAINTHTGHFHQSGPMLLEVAMKIRSVWKGVALSFVLAGSANAGTIPYPNSGTPNPVVYTFIAANSGDIIAYFGGSGASLDEQVGMLVNGVATGNVGLDDHSTAVGASFDLGHANAGDTLTFFDQINGGATWYSDPSLNGGNGNHVYSTSAMAGQVFVGSIAGTYVGFEDLTFPNSDFNYFDDTFVFSNTVISVAGAVPEPSTWAMMILGFCGVGFMAYRRKQNGSALSVA